MATVVKTETVSTLVDINSAINLRAGSSIIYSNTNDGALSIDTMDFNRIICEDGSTLYSSTNTDAFKTLTIKGYNGIEITGEPTTNTLTIKSNGAGGGGFSNIYVFSSVTSSSPSLFPPSTLISSYVNDITSQNTLKMGGIEPFFINPDPENKFIFMGIDTVSLLSTVSTTVGDLNEIISSYSQSFVISSLEASTVKCTNFDVNNIITSTISIGPNSTLMAFNFSTMCVGINKPHLSLTNGVSLDVKGTILAHKYATYSDPSLKEFIKPYTVSLSQIDSFQPSHFRWLSNKEADIGFSATEIEKILPTAVSAPNGIKMVDYSKISIISIAALKDANMRIMALESTVNALQLKLGQCS
jgi:hypothetical protein